MKTAKKMISVILLLGMAGSAFAVDTNWNNSSGDRLWRNASNWSAGIPTADDKAAIRASIDGPIIDSSTTAVAEVVVCGDWGNTDSLDITGGSLTTDSWIIFGYNTGDDGTFNVSGGTTTVGQNLAVGFIGVGHLNMTSGTVTVIGTFGIATDGGSGDVELDGGTISCGSFSMSAGATMSIDNTGKLEINGDATGTIDSYRINGWLTAYGGSGTLNVDYGVTTAGKTTVTANPPEKAANPDPGNGDTNVSFHTDLSWTPGIYAVSHDVYFGTDSTPDATEFQGNQSETTFDPGVLDINTTYYWRIDEVNPGNPASPWPGVVWSFKTQADNTAGKIVYPWNATTAIVKAGETFEVWFDADPGQTVSSVTLKGPYNTVSGLSITQQTNTWVYDTVSGNTCNRLITVTVPANTPADRYDLLLNTSYGQVLSRRAVKVVKEYKTDYSILHISDSHMGGSTSDPQLLKISTIAEVANIIGPEMLFITGDDINWSATNFQDRVDHFYDGYEPTGVKGLHGYDAATFAAVGNHDFTEGSGESFSCCYESKSIFWNQYHGLQYHKFEYGNTRCMVVNTGWASYDYGYQLTDFINWLNDPTVGQGNLRIAAYHQAEGGIMGSFANNPSVNLGLSMIGHNHHLAADNPYDLGGRPIQYFANSLREHFPFNLYRVHSDGSYTVANNQEVVENPADDPSLWRPKLTLTYAGSNDGTSTTNTATIVNNFGFAMDDARVRFVMPKGFNYGVSQGTVAQQFDGDQYRIVDVSVDVSANSTAAVDIYSSGASGVPEGPSARGEHAANDETADKAFDGDDQTKWLDFSPTGSWIQWRYPGSTAPTVKQYAITSANDLPERDPMDWNLLGSNDHGYTWDVLDSRTGEIFASRFQRRSFFVSNPGDYNIYRLEITAVYDVGTANSVQLAEFQLSPCAGLADFNCNGTIGLDDFSYMAGVWLIDDPMADVADPPGQVGLPEMLVLSQEWLIDPSMDAAVAYWKLDETAGDLASDYSRNGHPGTLINMDNSDWVEGNTGNALDFDGVNDYVASDVCVALAGRNVTVSAWMKAPALNPAVQFIIAINSSAGDNKLMFGIQANTATLSFADSEPLWRDTTATVIDNTWHHVAFVLDDIADAVNVYVDGAEVLSFTSTVSIADTDLLSLAQEYDAGLTTGDFYSGQLDDIKVYDYALNQTQIRLLYNPSALLAHWELDETAGSVASDSSLYDYDGTLVNMDDSDWVEGNIGNALDFDGVNDHVAVDDICAAIAGRDITVTAWVKAPAVNPANQFIISINTSNGDDNRLLLGTPAGTATLSLGTTAWHHTTATVIDNTWHHVAYVLEDSSDTITVYVDGSEALSFASTVSVAADDVFSLAQEYDPGMATGDFYNGQIDDVRVYERALSEAEIATLAQD